MTRELFPVDRGGSLWHVVVRDVAVEVARMAVSEAFDIGRQAWDERKIAKARMLLMEAHRRAKAERAARTRRRSKKAKTRP